MLDVLIEDNGWLVAIDDAEALIEGCHSAAVKHIPNLAAEIAFLMTTDAAVKALNSQFRAIDKPTNVLSFPAGEDEERLGDIAFARETCLREAKEKAISGADHLAHLAVHGMLHLVGYDHETDSDANEMENLEVIILGELGIADPYIGMTGNDT